MIDLDLEDEIPIFWINSIKNRLQSKGSTNRSSSSAATSANSVTSNRNDYIEENLPILIKDILKLNFTDSRIGKNLEFCGIKFHTLTIYGNCIDNGLGRTNKRLIVDDGTGSVSVTLAKSYGVDENKILGRLKEELNVCSRGVSKPDDIELNTSLKRILDHIEKETNDLQNLEIGDTISVIGIPYKIGNETRLYAEEVKRDVSQNRNKEIFFKRHLIRNYKERYLKC